MWFFVGLILVFYKLIVVVYFKEGNKRLGLFVDIICYDNLIILCNILVIILKEEIKFYLEVKFIVIR